jgi:hypothetical protein
MITLTCGHTIEDLDDAVNCSIRGWTRDHRPAVDYMSYCASCYEDAKQSGFVLFDEGEENKWLGSGRE